MAVPRVKVRGPRRSWVGRRGCCRPRPPRRPGRSGSTARDARLWPGRRSAPGIEAGRWSVGGRAGCVRWPGPWSGPAPVRHGRWRPPGGPSDQNAATVSRSSWEPRYWRMPGAWPPGRSSPSNRSTSSERQLTGSANSRCGGQLAVVLRRASSAGTELAEQDAGKEAGIAGRRPAARLGGEGDGVPGIGEQAPRHRDLGGVEVPVRQRHEYVHDRTPRGPGPVRTAGVGTVPSAHDAGQCRREARPPLGPSKSAAAAGRRHGPTEASCGNR